ncbi:MAG: hypothetical protein H7Z37_01460 [Pyrinomonadaceae bacterium]|nr:hypothetical protein [Pyrinomonadaceae bacterium]
MQELDEMWQNVLREAREQSETNANSDVADYIKLREINDLARNTSINWLFDAFSLVVAEFNRRGFSVSTEKTDSHKFSVNAATMRGSRLELKFGVRAVTIEAGFPQVPGDGFIRGNGLACAKISHFGMSNANANLLLVKASDNRDAPVWYSIDKDNLRQPFSASQLRGHFAVFLGNI